MFKKTADLLGNTDLAIVGTPKIIGSVTVDSDSEFPGLKNNGMCEFRVEIRPSVSPYTVVTETFDFDTNTVFTITDIVSSLNSQTSLLVFDSDEGCLSIESSYSGHKAYIKILTKTTGAYTDPLPLLGLFADPHPSSISQAKDISPTPVKPATQNNKHGSMLIGRKEDRLSSAVNRAVSSVALNSEHTQHQVEKPIAIALEIELDETTHSVRLHKNTTTDTYEYLWLGYSSGDSIDVALGGRRIFVGGLDNSSNLYDIQKSFLLKTISHETVHSDGLDHLRIGAVISYGPSNPAGSTTITAPAFNSSTGEISSGNLANSSNLYSDYGNVLGVDLEVYPSASIGGFTKSTIVFTGSIANAEVGFKVVVQASNPANYSNDGTYIITKIISDTEVEVRPFSSDEPKILNDAANGSYTPTAVISSGGEFIHNAVLLFEPNLIFPSNGKIILSLYVESSIEDYGAEAQQSTLAARSSTLTNYNLGLNDTFQGTNPSLESGYFMSQAQRGIQIVAESTLASGAALDTANGPHTGQVSADWVLTAATGEHFHEDSLGSLFKVDDKWARATSLIDFKNVQLTPLRKLDTISLNTSAIYYRYTEQNGLVDLPASISTYGKNAPGYVFVGESASTGTTRQKGYVHLTQITATADNSSLIGKTGDLTSGSDLVTLDFNPIESGVIHPSIPATNTHPASLPTVVCISTGSSVGWFIVRTMTSTQIELAHFSRNAGSALASATETASIHFYTQTVASQQLLFHLNRLAYPALTLHGETGRDHQANSSQNYGLAVSWNSEGGGILATANRNGLQGSANGSTGYVLEGHISSPAEGIYLNIGGTSGAANSDLAGSYGLNIITTSDAYNVEDFPLYRSAASLAPKAAISIRNTGGDSNIIATRGSSISALWDSPLADFRDISDTYGAGGAFSLQGSWYSRYSSQVYLNGEQSVLSSTTIIPQKVGSEVARIGSPGILFTSTSSLSRIDADYADFKIPHASVFSAAGSTTGIIHELPGQELKVTYTSTNSFTGKVLAVKDDGGDLLIATDITSATVYNNGNVAKVEILGSRFRLHADVEDFMFIGRDGSFEPNLPVLSKSSSTPNDSNYRLSPYQSSNFGSGELWALGHRLYPKFYTIDSYSGINSTTATLSGVADVYTVENTLPGTDRDTEFHKNSFMDMYNVYYQSIFEDAAQTPGGHAQFGFGDTLPFPRTSYSTLVGTGTNGTGSHGSAIKNAGIIVGAAFLNSPFHDSFFIRFPTVYNSTAVPDRTDGKSTLDTRFVEWFKAVQITPTLTNSTDELVYQFCKLGPSNFNSNQYYLTFKASVGIQQYNADSNSKIEVTPVLLVFDEDNESSSILEEGTTVQVTSLFQTITEVLSSSVLTSQTTRDHTAMASTQGQLVVGLKVRHYYTVNPTGTADTTMNRFFVRVVEAVESSRPVRVGNLEAYGSIIAPSFSLSTWKHGGQTVSPAHVDLFGEESPMQFATHPTNSSTVPADYKYGRIGANGVGAILDSANQWVRPTYSREYFFNKGTHSAVINLYHPFYDPLWYALAGQKIHQWLDDPVAMESSTGDLDALAQAKPDIESAGLGRVIMPGPTGFTIPLNPPNGAILTGMDWHLFMQASTGNHINNASEASYGAFWADKPSNTTTGNVELLDGLDDYGSGEAYEVSRWNRVSGVRINLYRFNCMGTNQKDHEEDGFPSNSSAFRAGAELIWASIGSAEGSNPLILQDSSNRQLVTGRTLRGSARFYGEGLDRYPSDSHTIGASSGGLSPDSGNMGNPERFIVDNQNYSYFATITFYGGNRMSTGNDAFSFVHRTLNGHDMASFLGSIGSGDSAGNIYHSVQFPYAPMRAGLMDQSTGVGDAFGSQINMGFTGFRVCGPKYIGTSSHTPHFSPKVHFRGFKLNWKTNKV